jgi:sec-independent protein translocase protein TatA
MGGLSLWHWLVVGIVVLLLFGKGRFSDMMGDVAKGLKSFKKGMSEEDDATHAPAAPAPPAARLQAQPAPDPNPDRDLQPMKDDRPQG